MTVSTCWRRRPARGARPGDVFFGNYICVIPHTDAAFVAVSKNAVTFLKKVARHNALGRWPDDTVDVHRAIGYSEESSFLVKVAHWRQWQREHGPRRVFAVWRDPVERIESTYALFCLAGAPHDYFSMLGLQRDPSLERFFAFLEWEWSKTDPLLQDEHVRAQVDYYGPGDVDDVVSLGALHDYLRDRGIDFRPERSNASGQGFRLTDSAQIGRVQAHYAADYAIEVTVS